MVLGAVVAQGGAWHSAAAQHGLVGQPVHSMGCCCAAQHAVLSHYARSQPGVPGRIEIPPARWCFSPATAAAPPSSGGVVVPLAMRVAFSAEDETGGARRAAFCSSDCCGYVLCLFAHMAYSSGWEFFSKYLESDIPAELCMPKSAERRVTGSTGSRSVHGARPAPVMRLRVVAKRPAIAAWARLASFKMGRGRCGGPCCPAQRGLVADVGLGNLFCTCRGTWAAAAAALTTKSGAAARLARLNNFASNTHVLVHPYFHEVSIGKSHARLASTVELTGGWGGTGGHPWTTCADGCSGTRRDGPIPLLSNWQSCGEGSGETGPRPFCGVCCPDTYYCWLLCIGVMCARGCVAETVCAEGEGFQSFRHAGKT